MLVVVNEESGGQLEARVCVTLSRHQVTGLVVPSSNSTDWRFCCLPTRSWYALLVCSFTALPCFHWAFVLSLFFLWASSYGFFLRLMFDLRFKLYIIFLFFVFFFWFWIQIIYYLFLINKSIHKLILTSAFNWNKVN